MKILQTTLFVTCIPLLDLISDKSNPNWMSNEKYLVNESYQQTATYGSAMLFFNSPAKSTGEALACARTRPVNKTKIKTTKYCIGDNCKYDDEYEPVTNLRVTNIFKKSIRAISDCGFLSGDAKLLKYNESYDFSYNRINEPCDMEYVFIRE